MYINGERKGFAKNGNTVENPYKQRNDSNLVESEKKHSHTHLYGKESGSNEKEQSREGKMWYRANERQARERTKALSVWIPLKWN